MGFFQTRIVEWVALSFSRGSSPNKNRTCVSCIGRQILFQLSHQGNPYYKTLGGRELSTFFLSSTMLSSLYVFKCRKYFCTHERLPTNIWKWGYSKRVRVRGVNIGSPDAGVLARFRVTQIWNFHNKFRNISVSKIKSGFLNYNP